MNLRSVLISLILLLSLLAGVYFSTKVSPPEASIQYANMYPAPRDLGDVQLTDQQGQAFTAEQLKQHWTLAFVGYTYCPDICPTTLASLNEIYPELQKIKSEYPVQVLFISVDPARDTTERLKDYIAFFNPEFIAASAEHAVLFPLIRKLGMMYGINDSTEDGNYLVDHSASVVIINPQAQVIGRFKPTHQLGQPSISDNQKILADMPLIMRP
ncbi:SCO family protein [Neptunicella marina]|uniref:SCO family protein n=1 Tax=Neptunicella marina TaxID=2125989 RepID=A0A8J6IUM1_9ALTE|nr:SCO family protein [Neptunicella marina]MBC3765926.1 SCO family protein [Neptunicella marina]